MFKSTQNDFYSLFYDKYTNIYPICFTNMPLMSLPVMKAYSKILLFVTAMALIVLVSSSPFHSGVAAETKKISESKLYSLYA